jgi:hypothetical protein
MHYRIFLIGLGFAFLGSGAHAQPFSAVDVRVAGEQRTQEVIASTSVSFSPEQFIQLVINSHQDCSWIAHCKNVDVMTGMGTNTQLVHTLIDSPWPFKNRDMVVYSELALSDDKQMLTITLTDAADQLEISDQSIRMTEVSGEWRMAPLSGTAYQLTYTGTASPNGKVPQWLALKFLKDSTLTTFNNIQHHFASEEPLK